MTENSYQRKNISKLVCYGCAHSAALHDYPSFPSGERPCCFCVRNPKWKETQDEMQKQYGKGLTEWYDGTPAISIPMDCYHTCDMKEQFMKFSRPDMQSDMDKVYGGRQNREEFYKWIAEQEKRNQEKLGNLEK
jgi:hypothetical protein